jgi:hypothetical protein
MVCAAVACRILATCNAAHDRFGSMDGRLGAAALAELMAEGAAAGTDDILARAAGSLLPA